MGMEEVESYERSLDDVSRVITFAKLNEEDLLPVTQVFSFAPALCSGDLKLLEMPPHLANSLTEGEILTLRGSSEDGAVLCTQSATFSVKEAETSNSLLVVPSLVLPSALEKTGDRALVPSTVEGVFYKYLEVLPTQPTTKRLHTVLRQKSYKGGNIDQDHGLTLLELLDTVQASEEEIVEGLRSCQAVRVDGEWFSLDPTYHMKVVGFIFRFFDESSWSLDFVRRKETIDALKELVNTEVCKQIFNMYCLPIEGGGPGEFAVDRERVSRFYGSYLLASTKTSTAYSLTDFSSMWAKAVPEGITTCLSQLSGLCLVDDTKDKEPLIKHFPESLLPENVQERLSVLFAARERWTLEDISPYIKPLATTKLNVNALLTKFARTLNIGGAKYFCAKHGK